MLVLLVLFVLSVLVVTLAVVVVRVVGVATWLLLCMPSSCPALCMCARGCGCVFT